MKKYPSSSSLIGITLLFGPPHFLSDCQQSSINSALFSILQRLTENINEKLSTEASYFLFLTIKLLKARGVKKKFAEHFAIYT